MGPIGSASLFRSSSSDFGNQSESEEIYTWAIAFIISESSEVLVLSQQ